MFVLMCERGSCNQRRERSEICVLTFDCRCVAGILLGRAAWWLGNGDRHGRPSQLIEPRSSVCRPECAVLCARCKALTRTHRWRQNHSPLRAAAPTQCQWQKRVSTAIAAQTIILKVRCKNHINGLHSRFALFEQPALIASAAAAVAPKYKQVSYSFCLGSLLF